MLGFYKRSPEFYSFNKITHTHTAERERERQRERERERERQRQRQRQRQKERERDSSWPQAHTCYVIESDIKFLFLLLSPSARITCAQHHVLSLCSMRY